MSLISDLGGIKDTLFGKDSEVSGSGNTSQNVTGSQTTKDSGSTTTTANSGSQNNSTSNTSQTTQNSGSVNTIVNSARSDTSTTTTSGRDDYTQTILTTDALQRLVNQALEGTQGLAATISGQKGAGAYDSSTTALLTNDLLARIAGEVAVKGAKTVTHIGGTTQTTNSTIGGTTQNQLIGPSSSTTTGTTNTVQNIGSSTSTAVTGPKTTEQTSNLSTNQTSSQNQYNDQKGLLDWIVCSELYRQGRMSKKLYVAGGKKFLQYDDRILKGYYYWAPKGVQILRENPNGIVSRVLEHVFVRRAKDLAGIGSVYDKGISGGVYLVCWILSRTVARHTQYKYLGGMKDA